ncbi:hypothetical protein HDU93_000359 [Gonapodya sp. JEL0774]|nr:hypothetical protein HDU93_000359 [Gonapodya sp. JEL0774]
MASTPLLHSTDETDEQKSSKSFGEDGLIRDSDGKDNGVVGERELEGTGGQELSDAGKKLLNNRSALRKRYPTKIAGKEFICGSHLVDVLMYTSNQLLEEDAVERGRFQELALQNMGQYLMKENRWQEKFDRAATFGEKAADAVARQGGSWRFVIGLISFLAFWMGLNSILATFGSAWDQYPFILLNLILSTLAAFQAPIIMMSQNRQSQIDHVVNDYVSTTILRSEQQIRQVGAKMDLLVNNQWRRLLEIQEIELDLIRTMYGTHRSGNAFPTLRSRQYSYGGIPGTLERRDTQPALLNVWSAEVQPDGHLQFLLRSFLGNPGVDDQLVFSHWLHDGDNFIGTISDIKIDSRHGKLRTVTYTLLLSDPNANLDDLLSGDNVVWIRNDFDVTCMDMGGQIRRITIKWSDGTTDTFANGDLPPRYKPAFALTRSDKITQTWKRTLESLMITYQPAPAIALLKLGNGEVLHSIVCEFHPPEDLQAARTPQSRLYAIKLSDVDGTTLIENGAAINKTEKDVPINLESILPKLVSDPAHDSTYLSDGTELLAYYDWPSGAVTGTVKAAASGTGDKGILTGVTGTVSVNRPFEGPGVWALWCIDSKVSLHGPLETLLTEES